MGDRWDQFVDPSTQPRQGQPDRWEQYAEAPSPAPATVPGVTAGTGRTGPRLKGNVDLMSGPNMGLSAATALMMSPILGPYGSLDLLGGSTIPSAATAAPAAVQAVRGAAGGLPEMGPFAKFITHLIPGGKFLRGGYEYLRDLAPKVEEPPAPPAYEPAFRPSSNVSRTMRFGGPAPAEYGAPGTIIPRKGWAGPPPEEQPIQPVTPEPFKVKPNVARTIRSGGPAPVEYGPARPISPSDWKPPEQSLVPGQEPIQPVAPTPLKVKPGVVKTKYGGPAPVEYGSPGKIIPRKGWAGPPPAEGEAPIAPAGASTQGAAVPKQEGQFITDEKLMPVDKVELNRMLHAKIQRLNLPGSPAGQRSPGMLTKLAQDQFSKSYDALSIPELKQLYLHLDTIAK